MRRAWKATKYLFWGFLALSSIYVLVCFVFPKEVGMAEAYYDLLRGRREIQVYGLPPFFPSQEEIILKERYGYRYRRVAGCLVNDFIIKSVEGYNQVMKSVVPVSALANDDNLQVEDLAGSSRISAAAAGRDGE